MAYLIGLAMAHVTSVHYAISNPFIYTIIFYFIKSGTITGQGAIAVTECYIPSGNTFTDETGGGEFTGDCYYTNYKKSRHWRVFYFCCWRAMNSEIRRSRNAICFFKSRRDAWFKRDI